MIVRNVEMASGAHSSARNLTSAWTLLSSIVLGLLGRPPGLPETPGLKLVDRLPPRGICFASDGLFGCLFYRYTGLF
jgi:hypothetical protein